MKPYDHNLHKLMAKYSRTVENQTWASLPLLDNSEMSKMLQSNYNEAINMLLSKLRFSAKKETTLHHCLLNPQIETNEQVIKVSVEEELELIVEGKCFCTLIRSINLIIANCTNELKITDISFDGSEGRIRIGSLWSADIRNAYDQARNSLRTGDIITYELYVNKINQYRLPKTTTIAVDASLISSTERNILYWATEQAVLRWNRLNIPSTSFAISYSDKRPDILIQGWDRLVQGQSTGAIIKVNATMQRLAERAAIRITTAESVSSRPYFSSPETIRYVAEHELGHFLGLADSNLAGTLMCGVGWRWKWPAPSSVEYRSLLRMDQLRDRYEKQLYQMIGTGLSSAPNTGVSGSKSVSMQYAEGSVILPLFGSQPDGPEWMMLIWEGERLLRNGNEDIALIRFLRALECSPDPYAAELRIGLTLAKTDPREGLRWLKRALQHHQRGRRVGHPAYVHSVLATANAKLGNHLASQWHKLCARIYRLQY